MGKENEWSLVGSETEYQNSYFLIERELIEQPNGTRTNYYRINFDSDGGVIALGVRERDIIFIELYRPRLDRRLLELPGGGSKIMKHPKRQQSGSLPRKPGLSHQRHSISDRSTSARGLDLSATFSGSMISLR